MEPKQISKKTAIEKIVDDQIDTIQSGERIGDQMLREILMYGEPGWATQSTDQLQKVLDIQFDGEYVINNEL